MRRSAGGMDGAGWPITLNSNRRAAGSRRTSASWKSSQHVMSGFQSLYMASLMENTTQAHGIRRSSRSSALRSAGDRMFRSTSESIGWSTSTSTPTAAQWSAQPMAAQQYSDAWEMDPTRPAGQIGARCGVARIGAAGAPRRAMAWRAQLRPRANSIRRRSTAALTRAASLGNSGSGDGEPTQTAVANPRGSTEARPPAPSPLRDTWICMRSMPRRAAPAAGLNDCRPAVLA